MTGRMSKRTMGFSELYGPLRHPRWTSLDSISTHKYQKSQKGEKGMYDICMNGNLSKKKTSVNNSSKK